MNNPRKLKSNVLLNWLRMGLLLVGLFLLGCLLIIAGSGAYLRVAQPTRLAMRYVPENKTAIAIDPQPLQVSPLQTNLLMIEPPPTAYFGAAAPNAAIWVNGKSFKSPGPAAWELVGHAWPLWSICAGTLICSWLLNFYGCRLKVKALDSGQ